MKRTLIIAEAGVNHNGDISLAKKLIDVAAEAGVDIVKFQTFKAEKLVSKTAAKADYQTKNLKNSEISQYEMLRKLELSEQAHFELINYCKKKNIEFLSSAFDIESIDFLNNLGIKIFKIPSGEITNYPYLSKIGSLNKKVILSTGMCNLEEIAAAIEVLTESGTKREEICILHCNSEYPTPMKDVNLNAMLTIRNVFNVSIGYSDHTEGIEIPIAAVALGADVIEKHFTLNKEMDGPDHKASLEPGELKAMVASIRNIEIALGDGFKKPSDSESKNIALARKSLFLSIDLPKGSELKIEHFTVKRPGSGISPMNINNMIGKITNKDLYCDHLLSWSDIIE